MITNISHMPSNSGSPIKQSDLTYSSMKDEKVDDLIKKVDDLIKDANLQKNPSLLRKAKDVLLPAIENKEENLRDKLEVIDKMNKQIKTLSTVRGALETHREKKGTLSLEFLRSHHVTTPEGKQFIDEILKREKINTELLINATDLPKAFDQLILNIKEKEEMINVLEQKSAMELNFTNKALESMTSLLTKIIDNLHKIAIRVIEVI